MSAVAVDGRMAEIRNTDNNGSMHHVFHAQAQSSLESFDQMVKQADEEIRQSLDELDEEFRMVRNRSVYHRAGAGSCWGGAHLVL